MEIRRIVPFGSPISITPNSSGSGSDFNWVTDKQFDRAVKKYEKEKRKRERTK